MAARLVAELFRPCFGTPLEFPGGDVGRHGIAIMAARERLGFEPPVGSDLACLAPPVAALRAAGMELQLQARAGGDDRREP